MGGVVVCGGSVIGLAAAVLLARAGHDVTVFERDDSTAPPSPVAAWSDWDRTGVAQFRQFHAYTSRARRHLAQDLPDVREALLAAGGAENQMIAEVAPFIPGFEREPGDDDLMIVRARRTTLEWVVRQAALSEAGVSWRPGARVSGVLEDGGVVRGVVLESGEEVRADLVVDAMGRRSRMGAWLPGRVEDEVADTGIVYFTRWYRIENADEAGAGVRADLDFTRCLLAPADHGFASLAFMAAADDEPLRLLGKERVFQALAESVKPLAKWVTPDVAQPMSKVLFMGGLQNSWRTMNVPGVVPVGDALMCTNPFFGRGVALGLTSAVALAAAVSDADGSPAKVSSLYADAVRDELRPWFEDSRRYDFLRTTWLRQARGEELTESEAAVAGCDEARFHRTVGAAMMQDPSVARAFIRWLQTVDPPARFTGDEALRARVRELVPEPVRRPGLPSRDEVVRLLTDAAASP